ncbi:hypothetical protein Mgra_00007760 [Meloidogyne graminicola]|uniref:Transmembrane cell adhesion receptor mua-3 n=1 Tax=Meloidogyne graminicola TaxID=189291 RepID=A0A8S9ZHZ4_9BILA|nr:hypothetical protein Mgra_00007760 [Meloidogyne graminicola]
MVKLFNNKGGGYINSCLHCDNVTSECIKGTCRCLPGFIPVASEHQQNLINTKFHCIKHSNKYKGANPCQDYSLNDCDSVAECDSDQPGYFQCKCPSGYLDISPNKEKMPGRICKKLENECSLGRHKCDINAECINTNEGYTCKCKPGWLDTSNDKEHAPGRSCKQSSQCRNIDCAPEAECVENLLAGQPPICKCQRGYVDISVKQGKLPGRVCQLVRNECKLGENDCSRDATCIDTEDSFTCHCKDGYIDESPQKDKKPGRICLRKNLPPTPECDVNDPMSCDKTRHEACQFMSGTYRCACANGYNRLPDGRCLAINECLDSRLNDCSPDAECIDQTIGFTCKCKSDFVDVSPSGSRSGTLCRRRVNECSVPKQYDVDCDPNANCIDTDESFICRCRPGFVDISEQFNKLPGRKCIEAVNECLDSKLNDCSEHAICEDSKESYTCKCKSGFLDTSPDARKYPGRLCIKPIQEKESNLTSNPFQLSLDTCDPNKGVNACRKGLECIEDIDGNYICACPEGSFLYSDGTCRLTSACKHSMECDKNAICVNLFDSFQCQCRPGFFDKSPDPETKPGRVCKELVNECASQAHDCSPFAECVDATDGFACICKEGFVDISSQHELLPGRRCSNASNECLDRSLNTCDESADCIDTPQGYSCRCIPGYVDVSTSANLPPGRVCTVQTSCPKQKTDLMFLVDGSGSIGSAVFRNEVLRFISDFVELFDIGQENTRVGLIQYSDQIRHEFDLNQYSDKHSLLQAIAQTQYLTGLTRTGAAIQHMVQEGFAQRRGARPPSNDVSRVAIVITDGRSQDNVTEPAQMARGQQINTFAIGVTDHVLAAELESIAGSQQRWFYVDRFKDLDMRLRSIVQKLACPSPPRLVQSPTGCSVDAQTGCDRTRNEICTLINKKPTCHCPNGGFDRHPLTHVCGGDLCNPELPTSCPHPEICQKTPFGNHRCACPATYAREMHAGICLSSSTISSRILPGQTSHPITNITTTTATTSSHFTKICPPGMTLNPRSGKCGFPGSCDPLRKSEEECDIRKREHCLLHSSGQFHTCQCLPGEKRHQATEICYQSPDPINKPGRLCIGEVNECALGQTRCSPDALCVDTPEGYICSCKPGFVDLSPNARHESGIICRRLVDECSREELNTCHPDAFCVDTHDSYKCICKAGFSDLDEFRNPGRQCVKVQESNSKCQEGRNDCDKNARCIYDASTDKYECVCPPNFRDKSVDIVKASGRVCIPFVPECDNPALNDCDLPDHAICTDTDEGYTCRCRQGFLDISPNVTHKPGRLCKQLENECIKGTHDCAKEGGICQDTPDSYTCQCSQNYLDVSLDRKTRPGRNCKRLVNECITGQHDCFPTAICTDTEDSYQCKCPQNYLDVSQDPLQRPGRRCLAKVNECSQGLHDCSPNAICNDTDDGYTCKCSQNFVDESPEPSQRPGRICRPALVNECILKKDDCHINADCLDLAQGFTCQCRPEYLDQSPNRITHPGRYCVPRPKPPPDECQLTSGNKGCRAELNEVCRIVGGQPKCACPLNYERASNKNKTGGSEVAACTLINECQFPQLNDCHPSAECQDLTDGFTCKCRAGFKDISPKANERPGRLCQELVNECQFPHLNDCHLHAECIDLEDGFQCRCKQGFNDLRSERPGRLCKQMIDECARSELNSCDKNAKCLDEEDGYTCECKSGFADVSPSPNLPGRVCRPVVNECIDQKLNDCDPRAKCIDQPDGYQCECPSNTKDISPSAAFPGRVCHVFENECLTGKHDCDPQAVCQDNEQAFTCECPEGFTDRSPNRQYRPGRVCVKLVDECKEGRHTCSPNADCRDLEEGYTCECRDGYVDRSPNLSIQPGRVCGVPETCPANHECSAAAVCEPQGGNNYTCTCIQGYIDQSPDSVQGRICVRNSFCRDPKLNNCSRKAVCYEEGQGYRCECARGYIDKSSPGQLKGRVCELPPPPPPPQRHPCQDSSHDCHQKAACRATGAAEFTCECLPGYEDRSPDIKSKPGRVCVLTEPICIDATRNDCHSAAVCTEDKHSSEGFLCRCRDGYVDQSPDKIRKPGRICVEYVNECLDRALNDCDALAICEDQPEGFTCRCPLNAMDRSPDKEHRPGRKCILQINECANPSLNNCSRFADCFDKPEGYECKCRSDYYDLNTAQPGTSCKFMQNECLNPSLNDCSSNAECFDTLSGYNCKCKSPFKDFGPSEHPGRICLYNECKDPTRNKCDKNAICEDTEDGFTCRCNDGFYDDSSTKGLEAGRVCIAFSENEQPEQIIQRPSKQQQSTVISGIACGHNHWCLSERNEVCVGGTRCLCRPGDGRASNDQKCVPVERTSFAFRVISRGSHPLFYSSDYGDSSSSSFVEFVQEFQKEMTRAIGSTSFAPHYVTTDVSYLTHPKAINNSWSDGLLVNFTIASNKNQKPLNRCELWEELFSSIKHSNGLISNNGQLLVAPDLELLNPCIKQEIIGDYCGEGNTAICRKELGEVCIAETLCGCPNGQKRPSTEEQCRPVESWQIPLWILRRNNQNLLFNETFANPLNSLNKEYVRLFEKGISQCYPQTLLKNAFVSVEVNEILDPILINSTWDNGLLFNATMHFRKGSVKNPIDVYTQLVKYIIERNGQQLGNSGLYLNPQQRNPFSSCFKNNCHPRGICIELGPNAYKCECTNGQRDLNPSDPGRKCVPVQGYNECEKEEENECSAEARCIDLEFLYKCECKRGYTDVSPKGSIPGSVCVLDYCSDVNYCPLNTSCVNTEQQAECQCQPGFVDIRHSESRMSLGYASDQYCLSTRDVDECALGLHNCSSYAICTNLPEGYQCQCPPGWEDGNLELPGRFCASKLCAQCHENGACIPDPTNNTNVICQCFDGYSGQFCELAPAAASLVLLVLLALVFLLLSLCFLLYLCTRCRCFYRRPEFAALDASASSDSGADFSLYGIPRAKLKHSSHTDSAADSRAAQLAGYLEDGIRIPRVHLHHDGSSLASAASSEFTIREEIERKITTDITRTEEIITDVDVHNESSALSSENIAETCNVYPSTLGTSVNNNNQQKQQQQQQRVLIDGELDRAESIAEFSNSRREGGRDGVNTVTNYPSSWRHYATTNDSLKKGFAFKNPALENDEDIDVIDKSTSVRHHRHFDPKTGTSSDKRIQQTSTVSSTTRSGGGVNSFMR